MIVEYSPILRHAAAAKRLLLALQEHTEATLNLVGGDAPTEFFAALMDRIVSATIAYLNAQVDAGAEALQLFDSLAGAVPAPLFDSAVIHPTARIVKAVKAKHPNVPIIGFPRAAG